MIGWADRRVRFGVAGGALVLVLLLVAYLIGTEAFGQLGMVLALLAAVPLLGVATRYPYLFPYGLYVMLIPFDGLLRVGSGGTLTKFLGIASIVFVAVAIARRRAIVRPPLPLYFALPLLAYVVVSLMWTSSVPNGTLSAGSIASLVLMYTVMCVAPIDRMQMRAICACIVIGGVLGALYGIVMLHGTGATVETGDYGRLMLTIGDRRIDPNQFANALVGPLAIAVVWLTRARTIAQALALLGALAILAEGVLISLSREALIACLAVGVTIILFSRRRVLGFGVLSAATAAAFIMVPAFATRMTDAFSTGGAGRTGIWRTDIAAWTVHPVFGWGIGGAEDAYNAFLLRVAPAYFTGWGRPPHNTLLVALVELGLVGAVLVSAAYLTSFSLLRMIQRGSELFPLKVALTAALVGLGIGSMFIDITAYKFLWVIVIGIAQLRTVATLDPATARGPVAVVMQRAPRRRKRVGYGVPVAGPS